MLRPGIGVLVRGCLVLALAVSAIPTNVAGGERHAGTVLAVAPETRTLLLNELAANAESRDFSVRLSDQTHVLRSERNQLIVDFSEVFKDTPITVADIHVGDFVVVELEAALPGVASLVMVTFRP